MLKGFNGKLTSISCAVLLVFSVVLSACSSSKSGGDGDQVTLRFSWWGGESRHKATLAAIDLYMKQNPNVKIEGEYGNFDGYYQKLQTQLAGGTAPDIIQLDYLWISDLLKQGEMFVDLYTLKDKLDLTGFDEQFLRDWAVINNQLQGVPTGMNAMTAIVNQDVMEREGIPLSGQWSWEQIAEQGRKLHQKKPNMYLINSDLPTLSEKIVPAYHAQLTGKYLVNPDGTLGFDQKSMTETFAFLKKLFDDGVLQPLGESGLYNAKTEQNPKWINGEAVMTLANVSDIQKHRGTASGFTITTTRFPVMEHAKITGINTRPAQFLGINKSSEHVEEAAKFLHWFFHDKEAILTLGVERSLPAIPSSQKLLLDNNKMDQVVAASLDTAIKNQAPAPSYINNNQQLLQISNDVIQKVAFGKQTPEAAAAEMVTRYEAKLKELQAA